MIRAGLYCRVSTDEQAENGDSLRTQQDALIQFAKKCNYQIIDTYIDDGYSGTNLKRPQLQRLLADVKSQKLDIILITKLDRWGRGVSNYYKVNDFLEKHKVHWKTVFEDYDTSTSNGKLLVNIMVSIAENESRTIGDRVKVVIKNKIHNKEWPNQAPFGYKLVNKKLVIDEEDSQIIKYAFDSIIKGKSLREIHRSLLGVTNHSLTTIRHWFDNKIYIGKYIKDDITINDMAPPIIELETFDKVQAILQKNIDIRKTYNKEKQTFIFTGLIFCKECGKSCTTSSRISRKGEKLISYGCRKRKISHNCGNGNYIQENIIEKKLIDSISKDLLSYDIKYQNKSKIKEKSKYIDELLILNNKLKELRTMVLDGIIEYPEFVKRCAPYKEKIKAMEEKNKLEEELKEKQKKEYALKETFENIISDHYLSFSRKEKKIFWNNILSKIYIDANRNISYEFRFSEEGDALC